MHLLGQLRENFADLDSIGGSLDRLEVALSRTTGLWIPCIQVAHAASIPEKYDVLGLGWTGGTGKSQQVADGHAEQSSSRTLQDASTSNGVIFAVSEFHFS